MTRFRRLICACTMALGVAVAGTSGASAATFYVNERGGSATCSGRGINACPTIKEAVARAEKVAGPNTIEVEPETGGSTYRESIELTNPKDAGLTIDGEEPGVVVEGKGSLPALTVHLAGAVTLSNLRIEAGAGATLKTAVAVRVADLTLDNVVVENQLSEGIDGIEVRELGSLTMNGGSVIMENGAQGDAVYGYEGALALSGVTVMDGSQSEANAGGVYSERSSLTLTNTKVYVESGGGGITFAIAAGKDTAVSMEGVTVRQNTAALGVVFEDSPATVNGLRIEMVDASSKLAALLTEAETPSATTTLSHVEVDGTWIGTALAADGGNVKLSDSRLIEGALSALPALDYFGNGPDTGLLVQRSVLQAAPGAKPGALETVGGNATTDSSEILGGQDGVYFEDTTASTDTLTLAASTIDAGAPGIAGDAAGVGGVEAVAKQEPHSVVNVSIEGSIVLERQAASAATGDQASIGCAYSAVPSQTQTAGGGAGSIACTSGATGNTEVNPLASLFPEPLSGYQLSPSSSAVDSVSASALALPFGFTPSATDLAGSPRVVDGNGDCVAGQDKGALELQGHAAPCPTPIKTTQPTLSSPKPVAGVISALAISPSTFRSARSGATVLPLTSRTRKLGAKVSWRDSQAATTTFAVLRPIAGRRQGKSCRKPSRANAHGKRCTLYVAAGSFTHVDRAGANSLRFSGRLKGKRLPAGTYRLQAVARNAAGNGPAASGSFRIR